MMGIVVRLRGGQRFYGERAPTADAASAFGLRPWGIESSASIPLSEVIIIANALVSVRRAENIGRLQRAELDIALAVARAVSVLAKKVRR